MPGTITPVFGNLTLTTGWGALVTNTSAAGSLRLTSNLWSNIDGTNAADLNIRRVSLGSAAGQLGPANLPITGASGISLPGVIIVPPGTGIEAKASANGRLCGDVSGELIT